MTLHLLYLVGQFPKTSETFVANEIRGLAARGHRVTVVSLKDPDGPSVGDARVHRLQVPTRGLVTGLPFALPLPLPEPGETLSRRVYAGAAIRWIARQVHRDPPQIVHAHFVNRPTLVARQLAAHLGVPHSFMTHASDYRVGTTPVALQERLRTAAAAFVVSESARRQLAERLPNPAIAHGPNVHVIRASMGPLDPPLDILANPLAHRPEAAARPDAFDILSVARLVPKKGLDTGIRAFAAMASRVPHARYRIAGDGPEASALASLARDLGVSDRVEFLGLVSPVEARRLTREAAVALLPCRIDRSGDVDGIPVSLMEAGSAGVPVISTHVSGLPELVETGHSGILTDPDDVEAVAQALVTLATDPDRRRAMGVNLRRRVETEFSQDTQLARLETIWGALLGATSDPHR